MIIDAYKISKLAPTSRHIRGVDSRRDDFSIISTSIILADMLSRKIGKRPVGRLEFMLWQAMTILSSYIGKYPSNTKSTTY